MSALKKTYKKILLLFAIVVVFLSCYYAPWKNFFEATPSIKDVIGIIALSVCTLFLILAFYRRVLFFVEDIYQGRRLILELAKNDLRNRFLGSYLGIVWAFIQPVITIFIFWFVFQVGFKSAPVQDFPFILWLVCGMVPWFFFSESFLGATNSILENSYLVKKVVFKVSILPIVRIISSLFIHLFFIAVIFIMFLAYGYKPSIYNLQVIYYLFASIILILGLSWITSSLVIFLRDMGQIISIIIQFGFWLTPIFWSFKIMPEKYHFIFKLNPMYYIIEGYRDSFINHAWFWHHYNLTINFWMITCGILIIGIILFKRLRPHFADVL
jgi:lipopolysaccharide transport system permease protein/teichoic acid transport system permease protein